MKIFDSDGHELCDLPDRPKNFDCGHKAGLIDIFAGDDNIKLGRYSPDTAERIIGDIRKAYFNNLPEFTMPEEVDND